MEFHTALCEITTPPPDCRLLQLYWPSRRFLQGLAMVEQHQELEYEPLEILDNLVYECSDFGFLHEAGFGQDWFWFINEILNQWLRTDLSHNPENPYSNFFMEGHKAFIRECAYKHGHEIARAGGFRPYIRINAEKVIFEDEIEDERPKEIRTTVDEMYAPGFQTTEVSEVEWDIYSAFRPRPKFGIKGRPS